MEPLLEIQTIPVKIRMQVNHAQLEYVRGEAALEIRREKGGLSITSRPIQVRMDSYEGRRSMAPTTADFMRQQAQAGLQAVYEATSLLAREGRMMMEVRVDQDVLPELARQAAMKGPVDLNIRFLPESGPDVAWDGGELSIQYEMDKLRFDWQMEQMEFRFTPGDIEFTTSQLPDVIVKYIGGPLFVPPSADPNHPPVDIKA